MTTDMSGRAVTAASERASMPFPGASPATCTSMFSGASVFNANVASWNTARVANLAAEGADARFAQCSNAEGEGKRRGRRKGELLRRELGCKVSPANLGKRCVFVAPEPDLSAEEKARSEV